MIDFDFGIHYEFASHLYASYGEFCIVLGIQIHQSSSFGEELSINRAITEAEAHSGFHMRIGFLRNRLVPSMRKPVSSPKDDSPDNIISILQPFHVFAYPVPRDIDVRVCEHDNSPVGNSDPDRLALGFRTAGLDDLPNPAAVEFFDYFLGAVGRATIDDDNLVFVSRIINLVQVANAIFNCSARVDVGDDN